MKRVAFTRADLIQRIYEDQGPGDAGHYLTKADVDKVIRKSLATIADTVMSGRRVELRGFAVFKPVDVPERKGRNPQTGEAITLPAHKRVSCKVKFGEK